MRPFLFLAILICILGGVGWYLTRATGLPDDPFAELDGDAGRGEAIFWAGGCASCHAAPNAQGDGRLVLAGGQRFPSEFGTFHAPNISPDPQHGIGGWSLAEFGNALQRGVSPEGQHYYPAFPYTAFVHMQPQDVADLKAFMDRLPASDAPTTAHELGFPFNVRRGVGLWKLLYLKNDWALADAPDPQVERGRYLAEALGHCGECHTPRGQFGELDRGRWLGGAPNPTGQGRIPNITSGGLDWSADDIAYFLETGFTPDFDSAGGEMALVVQNMSHLTAEDRAAIAAYVKAVPAVAPSE